MYFTSANKFTYPLMIGGGYMSTFSKKWFNPSQGTKWFFINTNWFGQEKKVLGRWNLKHTEKDLNKFYRYLPDPGYPNNYGDTQLASIVLDSSLQYNRSGKKQN